MDLGDYTSDVLIERVSLQPCYILNSMMTICDATQPHFIQEIPASSIIGLLGTIPSKLLHIIFNQLDFRSLSHFARVLPRKGDIESLPAYLNLVTHASKALVAFSRTELITFDPAASIYTALLSENS